MRRPARTGGLGDEAHGLGLRGGYNTVQGGNTRTGEHDTSRTSSSSRGRESAGQTRRGASALDRLKDRLASELDDEGYGRYLGGGDRLELDGARLDVRVPDRFTASLIDRRYGESLRRALREELGSESEGAVTCRVDRAIAPDCAPRRDDPGARPARAPARAPSPIRDDQRLDDFVVGEANRVAHSACVQLCDRASPLRVVFLHAPCGLGKTHLLRGVSVKLRQDNPGAKVRYLTGESFLNEYIARVREGRIDAFQARFRGLDLLCVDDVQIVLGKEKTQHQLLQAIETVQNGGGRVALASDTHPRQMRELSRALASRFVAGPVIRIDAPDRELRERLVRRRSERRGLALSDQAASMIADRASGAREGELASVRDLEGMIIQVEAVWRLLGRASGAALIEASLVARALELRSSTRGDDESGQGKRPVRLEQISEVVCREMGVQLGDVLGRGRHKRVVLTRALIVHVSRALTTRSYPEIARAMARTNHSTVITAHQRVQRQIEAEQNCDVGCAHDGLPIGQVAAQLEREVRRAARRG